MNAAASQQVILSPSHQGDAARHTATRTVGLHGFEDDFRFNAASDEKIQNHSTSAPPAPLAHAAPDDDGLSVVDKLILASEISMRYHKRRKMHYDGVYKIVVFSALMLSSAAFLLDLTHQGLIGFGVIGLGALSMVWNFSHKAREHDVLVHQYEQLLSSIRLTHTPTMDHAKQWRTQRLTIQGREPPIYWAVMNDCAYDVARAWDLKPKKNAVPALLRPFMNWIRF